MRDNVMLYCATWSIALSCSCLDAVIKYWIIPFAAYTLAEILNAFECGGQPPKFSLSVGRPRPHIIHSRRSVSNGNTRSFFCVACSTAREYWMCTEVRKTNGRRTSTSERDALDKKLCTDRRRGEDSGVPGAAAVYSCTHWRRSCYLSVRWYRRCNAACRNRYSAQYWYIRSTGWRLYVFAFRHYMKSSAS